MLIEIRSRAARAFIAAFTRRAPRPAGSGRSSRVAHERAGLSVEYAAKRSAKAMRGKLHCHDAASTSCIEIGQRRRRAGAERTNVLRTGASCRRPLELAMDFAASSASTEVVRDGRQSKPVIAIKSSNVMGAVAVFGTDPGTGRLIRTARNQQRSTTAIRDRLISRVKDRG